MRSSWPIVIGVAFLGAAAAWYDAKNEASSVLQAAETHEAPSAAQASFARADAPEERDLGTTNAAARPLVGTTR